MKIFIKNMACESCKIFVKDTLNDLGIHSVKVDLGEIETKEDITDKDKLKLNSAIKKAGLEILVQKEGLLIEKIRNVMVDYVYHTEEKEITNFSSLLSKKLNYSYSYLANFFSEVEATTIEQRVIAMKVERIKELIMHEENSLKEISYKLHYSSVAHLSAQFKKVTGLTPSHFKKLKKKRRISIQNL